MRGETVKLGQTSIFSKVAHIHGFQADPQPREELPEILQPEGTIMAIHPIIDKESFSRTMDNYRKYIANYNIRVQQENELINKHNSFVDLYLDSAEISDGEREMVKLFHKHYTIPKTEGRDYRKLTDREYNEKVNQFCAIRGHLIRKVKIQTIKPASELFFQNFLHLYSEQMNYVTFNYIKFGATSPRPLQELEIRSDKVTRKEREKGVKSLPVCNKTVRNHRQRLEEAGVLTDYKFCGHVAGVMVKINPDILVFNDLFAEKVANLENQRVRQSKRKKLPYVSKDSSTITSINQCKMKDDASQSSFDKEFATQTGSLHYKNIFYENTGCNVENSPGAAAAESVKVEKTLSENLRDLILHPQELAKQLAEGRFYNYVPIDTRILFREAGQGTLTEHEFRELWIQDFFKTFSKAYRNSTPWIGSWKKAINEFMDNVMVKYNGLPFNKLTIADYTEEYRWCIKDALQWWAKTGVPPLFPSDYFDRTRKTKSEISFEYQRTRYKRHLKGKADRAASKAKRERAAELRKTRAKYSKYFKTELNRYLKEKITLPQLINYVQSNLPQEYLSKLPEVLKKRLNNL